MKTPLCAKNNKTKLNKVLSSPKSDDINEKLTSIKNYRAIYILITKQSAIFLLYFKAICLAHTKNNCTVLLRT